MPPLCQCSLHRRKEWLNSRHTHTLSAENLPPFLVTTPSLPPFLTQILLFPVYLPPPPLPLSHSTPSQSSPHTFLMAIPPGHHPKPSFPAILSSHVIWSSINHTVSSFLAHCNSTNHFLRLQQCILSPWEALAQHRPATRQLLQDARHNKNSITT